MHRLSPAQWLAASAPGHHDSCAHGQGGVAESSEAAVAGGFPAEPPQLACGMGHPGEPSPRGGEGAVPHPGGGITAYPAERTPGRTLGEGPRAVKTILLALIRFYQACLSPLLPSSCRYYPSCSAYAYEAVARWGAWRGTRMAIGRLWRCRPWGGHGFDPVP